MANLNCVNEKISKLFYQYGKLIARHPAIFLVVPLIVAGCLTSGMIFMTIETDAAYLFTPEDSRALDELALMQDLFPVDYENFLPNRILTTSERGGSVIVTAKDGGSVLRQDIMAEILDLDRHLREAEIRLEGSNSSLRYSDLCCHFSQDECLHDPVLKLLNHSAESVDTVNLTYPFSYLQLFDLDALSSDSAFDLFQDEIFEYSQLFPDYTLPDLTLFLPSGQSNISINIGGSLGRVIRHENTDIVRSAGAMAMRYFVRSGSEEEALMSEQWERQFLETVFALQSQFRHIEVSMFASSTLSDELIAMAARIMPRFCVTFSLLIMFAVSSCMMTDWVLSKPWLGQLGVISAMLAIASSMGLLSYAGIPFNEVSASMPFLAIGIGIDDMFIMLAAWRKTSTQMSVEERLGHTYSDAAVSITITSITDALAFGIGSITKLPAIRVFCLYSGVAILFDFLYQITFFGACIVYTGRREAQGKHCTTLRPVLPKDKSQSVYYRLFCAGGVPLDSPSPEPKEHAIMAFFKDFYGPLITKPLAKFLTVILYGIYLASAIFGCFSMTEGMQYKDIFSDDSYAHHYMIQQSAYFTAFAAPVAVVVTEPLPYWEQDIQDKMENLTQTLEGMDSMYGPRFTTSWLREFLQFLKVQDSDGQASNGTQLSSEEFLRVLQEDFLTDPFHEQFNMDLRFENTSGEVVLSASRLILQPGNITTTVEESQMMLETRRIVDNSSLSVIVSSPPFEFFEQYLVVLPNTIQNLIIATICMCLIAMVFIPHPVSAVMITVCVVSIEVGVIGFMSLWDVSMDGVSMINIILCIGFSVDFSAHVAYAFVTAPCETGNEAAVYALHSLGLPILQGASSTILGIAAIATSPAYIFRSFFKTMFLVMTLGLVHGILFLPVLLTILRPCMRLGRKKPSQDLKLPVPPTENEADPLQESKPQAMKVLDTGPKSDSPGDEQESEDTRV